MNIIHTQSKVLLLQQKVLLLQGKTKRKRTEKILTQSSHF